MSLIDPLRSLDIRTISHPQHWARSRGADGLSRLSTAVAFASLRQYAPGPAMDLHRTHTQMGEMLSLNDFPLSTDRLVLRPIKTADFSAYAAYHGRAEVYRYLYASPPQGETLKAQFQEALQPRFSLDGDVFRLAVTLADRDEMLSLIHI